MSEWEDWTQDDSAWEAADEVASATSGGNYICLQDGEKVQVVFKGKPHAYKQVWLGNHSEIYDPDKHDGKKPSGRFMFAVASRRGKGKYSPALLETSATTYSVIKKALSKYGSKCTFELERDGTGTDTKYTCLFDHKLEGAELEHVASLEMLDAVAAVNDKADYTSEPTDLPAASQPFDDDDISF